MKKLIYIESAARLQKKTVYARIEAEIYCHSKFLYHNYEKKTAMKLFSSWILLLRGYCNSLRLIPPFTIWQTLYPHRPGVFLFKNGFTQLSLFVIAAHVRILYFIDKGNRKGRSSKRNERCGKVDSLVFKIMRWLRLEEEIFFARTSSWMRFWSVRDGRPDLFVLNENRERASAKYQYH